MEIIKTHTGKIYVDRDKRLEFLTVGDYGQSNNIKANFLGYTKEIHGVPHSDVDLADKWVVTISTQHGCPMSCKFCDVPKFGFYGNCSVDELAYQVRTAIEGENVEHTKRFNLHYARMGEPTFNPHVLYFTSVLDKFIGDIGLCADTIHPVVSTMLPKQNPFLGDYLQEWCRIKNDERKGEAGLQFSINSTDDEQRQMQFSGKSLSLCEIAAIGDVLPMPNGRKYTLNFAVTADTILDAGKLTALFDKEKFIVKLTPIHQTSSACANGFDVGDSYRKYSVYEQFEQPLLDYGWDVIVFVPSVEEDSDRITCGNALISKDDN